jgi:hypothetical protein
VVQAHVVVSVDRGPMPARWRVVDEHTRAPFQRELLHELRGERPASHLSCNSHAPRNRASTAPRTSGASKAAPKADCKCPWQGYQEKT